MACAATITGTVFEDVNYGGGAGRSLAASNGVPLQGVQVALYRTSNGQLIDTDTTNSAGQYSLSTGFNSSAHVVRVVNGTVRSSRSGSASCSLCVPVQTFRTDASDGSAVPVTNRVGGEDPALSDSAASNGNFSSLSGSGRTAQSIAPADPSSFFSQIDTVDFGFNFSTIVNVNDAASCNTSGSGGTFHPCQGSLRQFIINANALGGRNSLAQAGSGEIDAVRSSLPAGAESSIFMIPNRIANAGQNTSYANQLNGSGVAEIILATALPPMTGSGIRLDATTQTVNVRTSGGGETNAGQLGTGGTVGVDGIALPRHQRPEVQLTANNTTVTLAGSNQGISGFALRQGYISLSGSGGTVRNNLVGMTATGNSNDNSPTTHGINFSGANATIRANFVTVNNSGIRSDNPPSGSIVSFNEVARPASGHSATFDGILLVNSGSNVQVTGNLVRDQRGGGIELGFGGGTMSNITVSNNTVHNNGYNSAGAASAEPLGLVAYSFTGSNVVLSRNRLIGNAGPGIMVMDASGTRISENSCSGNAGLCVDLDPRSIDPNNYGTPNGVTLNDNGDADSGPNGLLNYPVISSAMLMNGGLLLTGFARPGSAIELYIAEPDPSGFGEGLSHRTTLVEGSESDLNNGTGTYGPAPVNGRAQGTDNTNRFTFSISVPAGVTLGSVLTSTATLAGQTSEFGGNAVVVSGPDLVHLKSLQVLSDPFNGSANPKSIPGAVELYTLRVTNQGQGATDANSITVIDALPTSTKLYVNDLGAAGSGPVAFIQGTPSSTLSWSFSALGSPGDDIDFSNDGGTTWSYVPTPDPQGYDAAVTHIRLQPKGSMAGAIVAGNPYFELRVRVAVN